MTDSNDPMGMAIWDYHKKGHASRLKVLSPMFDDDYMPVSILFRSYEQMNMMEKRALDESRGRVLDVGAGSGCHSIVLKDRGIDVLPVDISPWSVRTMRERGLENASEENYYEMGGKFDTILFLMNGSGLIGKMGNISQFFTRLDALLAEGGQALMDSTDLRYLYEDENGNLDLEGIEGYYGEVEYWLQYKKITGNRFSCLYLDFDTLSSSAESFGFKAEKILDGHHYDYLARITRK